MPPSLSELFLLLSYGDNAPFPIPRPMNAPTVRVRGRDRPIAPLPGTFPNLVGLTPTQRDAAVEAALLNGGLAPHLLQWVPVRLRADELAGTVYVSPDWVGFGDATYLFRVPLKARALQRLANRVGAVLPTVRIVDAVHALPDAQVTRIPFEGLYGDATALRWSLDDVRTWQLFNARLEALRAGRAGLVTDGAKDVVVGPMQAARRRRVCIYGGWDAAGQRVQPPSTVHDIGYGDYSQLGRLVRATMEVEGVGTVRVADVLADTRLCRLLVNTHGADAGHALTNVYYND